MMRDVLRSFAQQAGLFPKQPDCQVTAVAQQASNSAGLVIVVNCKRHALAANDQRLGQPADSAHAVLFIQEAIVYVRSAAVLVSAVPFSSRESTRNCGASLFTPFFVVICVMALSTPRFRPAIGGNRKSREWHFLLTSGTYFLFHIALLFRFLMLYYTIKGVVMGVVSRNPHATPWELIPSTVRSYINSEQPADIERALSYCAVYGLDYQEARRRIIAEMVREQSANEPARARRRK
jgi:hypothetical protein